MIISRITSPRGPFPDTSEAEAFYWDMVSNSPNVSLEIYFDNIPTELTLTHLGRDLLEFASALYLADESLPRIAAVDHWTRDFAFDFAVHDPQQWQAASEFLANCLSFLSGDRYTFSWPRRRNLPRLVRHRSTMRRSDIARQPFDRICLFSGGVDSLLGAVSYLERGERVVLIGHYADNATSAAQREIASALQSRFPEKVAFLQFRIRRHRGEHRSVALPDKAEKSHRTRSFLFLSLATSVSHAFDIPRIAIPENGLIALNPPIELSRTGSLSTRTAHPIFLVRFLDAMRVLQAFRGELENPFLFQSKTDMLRAAPSWSRTLLLRSVSCARPTRYQDRHVRHCGYCVPCLYRRAAFVPAGYDRASDYAFDAFGSLSSLTNALQADFRGLVRFARRVEKSRPAELSAIVLSHGYCGVAGMSLSPEGAGDWAGTGDRAAVLVNRKTPSSKATSSSAIGS